MKVKITFLGIGKLETALRKVERRLEKKANTLIAGAAMRTSSIAKMRLQPLPSDSRELAIDIAAVRQSINFTHDPVAMSAGVFAGNVSGDHMAAYLEFGTGRYAARYVPGLPVEFRRLAMTFYVNGKGRMKEHPYLIPAYLQEAQRLNGKLRGLRISW